MKQIAAVIIILFLFRTFSYAQQWTRIHDAQGDLDFCYSICFLDTLIGFRAAMMPMGNFHRSEDGGHTWDRMQPGFRDAITDIYFVNQDTGFVGGNLITVTCDGGEHWNIRGEPWRDDWWIHDIFFISDTEGWIVGGENFLGNNNNSIRAVLHTSDAGRTWNTQWLDEVDDGAAFESVAFADPDHGLIVGNVVSFFRTEDGGENWEEIEKPDIMRGYYRDTWQQMNKIVHLEGETYITAGSGSLPEDRRQTMFIYRTTDFGENWERVYEGGGSDDLFFVDSRTGWACSNGLILKTTNSGETWSEDYRSIGENHESFRGLFFLDRNNGWAVTYDWDVYRYYDNENSVSHRNRGDCPWNLSLISVCPNPFNSTTTITYGLPCQSRLSLQIYNPLGQRITTLYEGYQYPGVHTTTLTATNLPSGLYFVQMEAEDKALTRKVMLVR